MSTISEYCSNLVDSNYTMLTLRVLITSVEPIVSSADEIYYPYLGLHALKTTNAALVLTFGGGEISHREFKLCGQNLTRRLLWYHYPSKRLTSDGSLFEESWLLPFTKGLSNELALLDTNFDIP